MAPLLLVVSTTLCRSGYLSSIHTLETCNCIDCWFHTCVLAVPVQVPPLTPHRPEICLQLLPLAAATEPTGYASTTTQPSLKSTTPTLHPAAFPFPLAHLVNTAAAAAILYPEASILNGLPVSNAAPRLLGPKACSQRRTLEVQH